MRHGGICLMLISVDCRAQRLSTWRFWGAPCPMICFWNVGVVRRTDYLLITCDNDTVGGFKRDQIKLKDWLMISDIVFIISWSIVQIVILCSFMSPFVCWLFARVWKAQGYGCQTKIFWGCLDCWGFALILVVFLCFFYSFWDIITAIDSFWGYESGTPPNMSMDEPLSLE